VGTLELLSKVAEGSAAEVFLARTEHDTVLVELSRPGLSEDMELYGRFLDEARERQKLSHPHLVQRTTAGCRPDGRLYALTESLSGLHLGSMCPMLSELAVDQLIPLCEVLGYLHDKGVVHGNLRPSHVYLSGDVSNPVPKLLDMGLLLFRSTKSMKLPASVVLVQPEYLSPERISGQRATPRSDVYGLGVLAFELITGKPPFKGRDSDDTKRQHMTSTVPLLPDPASWLQPWLNHCLAKDPKDRFGSMAEVRDALLEANMTRLTGRDSQGTVRMRAPIEEPPVVRGKLESEAKQLGPYTLQRLIGEGGMGQVWLAKHSRLDRLVAIKLLRPELANVEQQVQRFVQEARAVNRVNHPHIVEIHDFVEEREFGRVWCVMEYLKGVTLKNLGRENPLSIARCTKIVRQVCAALEAAHKVGVVHRDIKPDNIFLVEGKGEEDFVKVLDFGVAKLRDAHAANHTETGEIVGTPAYMSPEQALGQDVDARSDLYSLGTLLYVLLAGRFPFDGVTAAQMVANIIARPPLPLPEEARSGEPIPKELSDIVIKALQKDPASRWQSMAGLAEALVVFETTQPVAVLSDEDLIDIDEAAPDDGEDIDVDVDLDEPARGGVAKVIAALVLVLASVCAAARFVYPVVRGPGGTAAHAAAGPHRVEAQVQAGPAEIAAPPPPAPMIAAPLVEAVVERVPVEKPAPAKVVAKKAAKKHRSTR
jgi:serine/threonine protein kinase